MKRSSKSHKETAGAAEQNLTGFAGAVSLLISALREIFDEASYIRFLNRRQLASSREAYAAFLLEHEGTTARRLRCC